MTISECKEMFLNITVKLQNRLLFNLYIYYFYIAISTGTVVVT